MQSPLGGTSSPSRLADQLRRKGCTSSEPVLRAVVSVRRDTFLPDVDRAHVYDDVAVVTKHDAAGNPVSSSSQPCVMASMLEQLQLGPGQRVLEIGAGTGYNAALIATLVTDAGRVTTVEIDADIAHQSREHLEDADIGNVRVVATDGWFGAADDAPFDRIMLTASTDDLSPYWVNQLSLGGILLVPLHIALGLQSVVAFRKEAAHLESQSVALGGFMPMRGAHGFQIETMPRVDESAFHSRTPLSESDRRELADLLAGTPRVTVLPERSDAELDAFRFKVGVVFRLALTEPRSILLHSKEGLRVGIFDPDRRSVALVDLRGSGQRVVAYGGDSARSRLAASAPWTAPLALDKLHITARATSAGGDEPLNVLRRRQFTFIVE